MKQFTCWAYMLTSRRVWPALVVGTLAAALSGCDTPYTRRVRQLDEINQQGYLSREDYMRFLHEAEQWDRPGQ